MSDMSEWNYGRWALNLRSLCADLLQVLLWSECSETATATSSNSWLNSWLNLGRTSAGLPAEPRRARPAYPSPTSARHPTGGPHRRTPGDQEGTGPWVEEPGCTAYEERGWAGVGWRPVSWPRRAAGEGMPWARPGRGRRLPTGARPPRRHRRRRRRRGRRGRRPRRARR